MLIDLYYNSANINSGSNLSRILTIQQLTLTNVCQTENKVEKRHGLRRELFFKNHKLLGLGRQIGLKTYEAFGVFLAKL